MKTALITGCNRGLGAGVRNILLKEGYRVIGLNRTLSKEKTMLLKDFLERLYNPEFKESTIEKMNPIRTLEANVRMPSLQEPDQVVLVHKTLNFEFKRLYNRQYTKVINILVSVHFSSTK